MSVRPAARRPLALALVAAAAACAGGGGVIDSVTLHRPDEPAADALRVLAVVAHPDDEIAFAGTLFKASTHVGAACDLLVITNGEAGFKYTTLAERIYRARLTDPDTGRSRLPSIRRQELLDSARVLGLRRVVMLHQTDNYYSKDPAVVLGDDDTPPAWDLGFVRDALRQTLRAGRYDVVLTHLPVPDTHGHHKAATILALQAIAELPEAERPVALGSYGGKPNDPPPDVPDRLDGHPVTAIARGAGTFVFDRTAKFGYRDALDYHIVVNWAIFAHRSQGTMQKLVGVSDAEGYLCYALTSGPEQVARAKALFARLAEPQFEAPQYDGDDAATRTPARARR